MVASVEASMRTIIVIAAGLILMVASSPTSAAVFAPGGETPRGGTCDPSGLIVCAGADAGANADCEITPAGSISCWWSYGWLTAAWSRAGLPGSESHTANVLVTACSSMTGCETVDSHEATSSCAWDVGGACVDGPGFFPPGLSRQLAMGECLTVTVDVHATIEAQAGPPGLANAVTWTTHGTHGAQECRLDDGRS